MNNLLVLARENAGAKLIIEKDGLSKILQIIETEKDPEMVLSAYRTMDQIANDETRVNNVFKNYFNPNLAIYLFYCVKNLYYHDSVFFLALQLLRQLSVEKVVRLLNKTDAKTVDSASLLVQRCFNALASMNPKENKKPDEETVESILLSITPSSLEKNKIVNYNRKQSGAD